MDTQILEELKKRLEIIDREREAIVNLIAVYEGNPNEDYVKNKIVKSTPTSFSVRGRVVDSIIELIHKYGRQVSNKEIMDYLDQKGVSLGDTKNKQASLAAILSAETKKKSARLRKITRGVFDIKK